VKAGDFGQVYAGHGRTIEVELDAVERFLGRTFTPVQLAGAGRHIPDPHEQEAFNGAA